MDTEIMAYVQELGTPAIIIFFMWKIHTQDINIIRDMIKDLKAELEKLKEEIRSRHDGPK